MTAVASPAVVHVRRVIAASPQQLFEAWLDPASLAQWMRPFDTTRTDATVDARVGGAYAIHMHTPGGVVEHHGEYVAIEPHTRLAFTWNSPHTGGASLVSTRARPPVARLRAASASAARVRGASGNPSDSESFSPAT